MTEQTQQNNQLPPNKKPRSKFAQRVVDLWKYFTLYEKLWYFSILALSVVFAFVFPEIDEVNGVNPAVLMFLYLADVFLNITCELLISKQSKWNFIVSLLVEITEIVVAIVCMYRFATLVVTIFFWIPIDIISFVNWHKHRDQNKEELTVVRTLNWWQSLLVVVGIAVWTVGIGYVFARFAPETDFFEDDKILRALAYIDACAAACGIANGLFILFRYREQWFAWYAVTILETVINVLSGQWVLLVLKVGYFTNTTYGFIRWTKYIRGAKALPELQADGATGGGSAPLNKQE